MRRSSTTEGRHEDSQSKREENQRGGLSPFSPRSHGVVYFRSLRAVDGNTRRHLRRNPYRLRVCAGKARGREDAATGRRSHQRTRAPTKLGRDVSDTAGCIGHPCAVDWPEARRWRSSCSTREGTVSAVLASPTSRPVGTPDSVAFRTRLRQIPDDGGGRGRDAKAGADESCSSWSLRTFAGA